MRGWSVILFASALGLGACGGGSSSKGSAPLMPAAMFDMRSLPSDADKRDALVASAQARPEAEGQRPLSKRERRVETGAATAAAVLGILFSDDSNAFLGFGGTIGGPDPDQAAAPLGADGKAEKVDPNQLVPWVRLGKPAAPPKPAAPAVSGRPRGKAEPVRPAPAP